MAGTQAYAPTPLPVQVQVDDQEALKAVARLID
jgi:hypothetical protein